MKEYYFALLGMSSALRHCVGYFSLNIVLRNRFTTNSYSALPYIAFHCLVDKISYNLYNLYLALHIVHCFEDQIHQKLLLHCFAW